MLPILMLLGCVVLRLIPHPPNFAPVGATSVFAGRTMRLGSGLVLTLSTMLISDFLLSKLHGYRFVGVGTIFVYAGFTVQLLLGRWLRSVRGGAIGAAVLGSVAFFLLSNFGSFLQVSYGLNMSGLVACYVAAIPFFGRTFSPYTTCPLLLSLLHPAPTRRAKS